MSDKTMARLPKWAQEKIAQLEMRARERETRIAELLPDAPPSDTIMREGASLDGKNLPTGVSIGFKLGPHYSDIVWVRVDTDRNGVYIDVNGGSAIAVEPRSSNLVYVRSAR